MNVESRIVDWKKELIKMNFLKVHTRANSRYIWKSAILVVLLIPLLLAFSIFAVSGSVDRWVKRYGGDNGEWASGIQQTSDGGYIVAGATGSFGAEGGDWWGSTDVWVLKLDSEGKIQWEKTYALLGWDEAASVSQTGDGGYIVVGDTRSAAFADADIWILKLDSEGGVQWQKTYGGESDSDWAREVQSTSDGGYIVVGGTKSFAEGDADFWLLKLDSQGNIQWQKSYGGSDWEEAWSISQIPDGGYIVTGYTESFGEGRSDVWVLKLDSEGNTQWQKTYGGDLKDRAHAIQPTSDEGYILAGWTFSFSAVQTDFWVLKLDSDGLIQWEKTYGGDGDDQAHAIQQTSDSGYIVAGKTPSFGAGVGDVWVLKLDPQGNIQWQMTYGEDDSDTGYAVQQTSDEGYVVAGVIDSWGSGDSDLWVLKLDPQGNILRCIFGPETGTSTATVADTSATMTTTDVKGRDSAATVTTTSTTPRDSSATVDGSRCLSGPFVRVRISICEVLGVCTVSEVIPITLISLLTFILIIIKLLSKFPKPEPPPFSISGIVLSIVGISLVLVGLAASTLTGLSFGGPAKLTGPVVLWVGFLYGSGLALGLLGLIVELVSRAPMTR